MADITVGQLRKELEGVDPNRIIVLSVDAEGNGFSPCDKVTEGTFIYDGYEGSIGKDDAVCGKPAIIFWP